MRAENGQLLDLTKYAITHKIWPFGTCHVGCCGAQQGCRTMKIQEAVNSHLQAKVDTVVLAGEWRL